MELLFAYCLHVKNSNITIFVLYAKYKSTKVQTPQTRINTGFTEKKNGFCTLVLCFLEKLSIYFIFFIYFLFFYILLYKNRVQEYKNAKNRLKTLINQHFFLYSALYFAFYVKYKSTKIALLPLLRVKSAGAILSFCAK